MATFYRFNVSCTHEYVLCVCVCVSVGLSVCLCVDACVCVLYLDSGEKEPPIYFTMEKLWYM